MKGSEMTSSFASDLRAGKRMMAEFARLSNLDLI
jgi:hypothetical protein